MSNSTQTQLQSARGGFYAIQVLLENEGAKAIPSVRSLVRNHLRELDAELEGGNAMIGTAPTKARGRKTARGKRVLSAEGRRAIAAAQVRRHQRARKTKPPATAAAKKAMARAATAASAAPF